MTLPAQPATVDGLNLDTLRALVRYDPLTGEFSSVKTGKAIGWINSSKRAYRMVSVMGKRYAAHRLAWFYTHGEWPECIDHLNGDGIDNRLVNLRAATQRLNRENIRKANRTNSHGFLGVTGYRKRGRWYWKAAISVMNKNIHLGQFPTPQAAHEAYLQAKRQLHKGCTL